MRKRVISDSWGIRCGERWKTLIYRGHDWDGFAWIDASNRYFLSSSFSSPFSLFFCISLASYDKYEVKKNTHGVVYGLTLPRAPSPLWCREAPSLVASNNAALKSHWTPHWTLLIRGLSHDPVLPLVWIERRHFEMASRFRPGLISIGVSYTYNWRRHIIAKSLVIKSFKVSALCALLCVCVCAFECIFNRLTGMWCLSTNVVWY